MFKRKDIFEDNKASNSRNSAIVLSLYKYKSMFDGEFLALFRDYANFYYRFEFGAVTMGLNMSNIDHSVYVSTLDGCVIATYPYNNAINIKVCQEFLEDLDCDCVL